MLAAVYVLLSKSTDVITRVLVTLRSYTIGVWVQLAERP
nr:MAG TPA: hypothetical protein [Caudoviricetes sp.]